MGGAVSSGESNDDLVDNLREANYIKNPLVEKVFRAVDRSLYYTQAHKLNAYKDLAWKDGNLHLSAPCIYSEVMENIQLEPGMSFLNIGSGTGYLSTMCGLLIGSGGVNHGIELYPDVVEYARDKQDEFLRLSPAIDMFDFCPPEFVVGNCLDPISYQQRYDRIYCGAACPEDSIRNITDLLKIGGICVIPINDSLVQITRISEEKEDRKSLLPVSFANLISPKVGIDRKTVQLPDWNPPTLQDMCRSEIRRILRSTIMPPETRMRGEEGRKKRRRRRQERRRASRLLVVQRRRSGGEDGETGFVAVAYSVGGNNSSDEDDNGEMEERRARRVESSRNGILGGNVDDEMRGRADESAEEEEDDDDFELPDLEDEDMQVQPLQPATPTRAPETSGNSVPPSAPAPTEPGSPTAGSSSGNRSSDNGHSNREPTSSSSGRSRGIRRIRNGRQGGGGSDSIFARLRELYRRREPSRNSDIIRRFEQNMQRLSSFVSSDQRGRRNEAASSNVAPMEEDNLNPRGENNRENDDSCVYSSDSSLDSSSSSADSSDEEDEGSVERTGENVNGTNGSAESGVDADKTEDTSGSKKKTESNQEGQEEHTAKAAKSKKNSFSSQMKTKIKELPLPPSIKVYLNYNRQF